MNQPLISVIIPVYNCEKTVAVAIQSILDQTYRNLEVIVVDDNSTDGTRAVVERLADLDSKIKIVEGKDDPERFDKILNRNVNAGYSARNTGFENVHGEYVTFQDADDASLLNRIEVQYGLLKKYNSTHLTMDWIKFNPACLGKKLEVKAFENNPAIIGPEELYEMSQRSKGSIAKISSGLNTLITFHYKRKRILNKFFFGSLENYPGSGNSPMFKREVIEKVQFRKLKDRVWPSFTGRGADKDFNFQVAETFKNSHMISIPLYMWRVKNQNPAYPIGIDGFVS